MLRPRMQICLHLTLNCPLNWLEHLLESGDIKAETCFKTAPCKLFLNDPRKTAESCQQAKTLLNASIFIFSSHSNTSKLPAPCDSDGQIMKIEVKLKQHDFLGPLWCFCFLCVQFFPPYLFSAHDATILPYQGGTPDY